MTLRNEPKRRRSVRLVAGAAVSAMVAVAAFATPANARWDHGGYDHHGWNGGYYRSPAVVYGGPYGGYGYYPPPVVYGPGIGINLPGVSIGIR